MTHRRPAPGRQARAGARRTGSSSRERILKAAIEEFALKGFDGTRVDEVARRSGVNKTLLYHYIGNKDRLFATAIEATYESIRERVTEFLASRPEPAAGMRMLVHLLMSLWVESPEFGRLLANENFLGGKHVRKSKPIRNMYLQLVANLNDSLKRGVKAGIFREGIDPVDLYISISSLSAYYVLHHHTLTALFHADMMQPRRLRQREEHIADMVLRYVCRRPEDIIVGQSRPAKPRRRSPSSSNRHASS